MKRDIDQLMKERRLDAAIVLQGEHMSPTFRYLTGPRAHLKGIVVWRPGATPYLVHHAMERDSAAATGFALGDYGSLGWMKMLEQEGSQVKATARLLQTVLDRLGIRGRVLVEGVVQVGWYFHILNTLREIKPDIEIVEDEDPSLFELARSTKDPDEVKTVRTVASVCERAYARIREILSGGALERKKLRDDAGWITIGRLRREVRRLFFEAGLVEPHGNIIAMGRDAGVPHNEGNDEDVLEEGRPIVVDLYPAQENGGYYFDVTRTYCVGRAPKELKELHALVHDAVKTTVDRLAVGTPGRVYQENVCDLFEAHGHRTIRQDERVQEGYVHGLGHGIGLEVHERPRLSAALNPDLILPGSLFTVEPGLYYPSRGLGVRIEDVIYAHHDGSFENLTHVPYELEIAPA
ncbi:MAG TPA: Xaa-Pro peptidase family protein [Candidatus Eisenbacteria bacterium]|nr:Xaa-Pro peptidase family protein [Candidatus Eisenbacteria bacterium]